jgi:bacteriocin biosynthesis cyclodehydratase domain-containing protein
MKGDPRTRRPRLALPFTILHEADVVRLVAGEDFRYSLAGPGLGTWLPDLFAAMQGRRTVEELIGNLEKERQTAAWELIERLYGERVLVDGPAAAAHPPARYRLVVEGSGPLAEALRQRTNQTENEARPLPVLCQDRLDYEAALAFNRRCRTGTSPWLWVTQGPMTRGYVSPAFLPDAGPCLACLLDHFRRLSPAPEIYDDLLAHVRKGHSVEPVPFPEEAVAMLAHLVLWKCALLINPDPPPALYRLHVLETDSLEVTSHKVFADLECPECGRGT